MIPEKQRRWTFYVLVGSSDTLMWKRCSKCILHNMGPFRPIKLRIIRTYFITSSTSKPTILHPVRERNHHVSLALASKLKYTTKSHFKWNNWLTGEVTVKCLARCRENFVSQQVSEPAQKCRQQSQSTDYCSPSQGQSSAVNHNSYDQMCFWFREIQRPSTDSCVVTKSRIRDHIVPVLTYVQWLAVEIELKNLKKGVKSLEKILF